MGGMASQITSLTIVYLNCIIRRGSKNQSSALLAISGNSPVTSEFPAQMASNAEIASIWSRQHVRSNTNLNTHRTGVA